MDTFEKSPPDASLYTPVAAEASQLDNTLIAKYSQDAQGSSFHWLSCLLTCVFPCSVFGSCYVINEQEEGVVLLFGKYVKTSRTPGIHCMLQPGRRVIKVSTRNKSHELRHVKVIDVNGLPLIVNAVLQYYIENSTRSALEVVNAQQYVELQATATLKSVISSFPYESIDGSACLKTESEIVSDRFVSALQSQVNASGARIVSLQLNEIAYAPEISSAMLKRQQAFALIAAREKLVDGAVDVACDAVNELKQLGHAMESDAKAKIVTNLIAIMCSERDVVPTITME